MRDLAFPDGKTIGPNHDILMRPGVTIRFTVIDGNGKPMEGVTVSDVNNKKAVSAKDGRLDFRNPDLTLGLTFHNVGYIDRKVKLDEIRRDMKGDRFVVVMEPLIALSGRVVAADGRPVAGFVIAAGPGKLPRSEIASGKRSLTTMAASRLDSRRRGRPGSVSPRRDTPRGKGKWRLNAGDSRLRSASRRASS